MNSEKLPNANDVSRDKAVSDGFLSRGFLYGTIAAVFYTISALCVRQLVALDSPYAAPLFVRESVATLFAAPIVIVGLLRHTIPTNQWRYWALLFGVSCLMQVLGNITYIWLFDMAGIAVALSCVWTGGLFSAQTFDLICLKERFNLRTFVGLTIVLAAVCCIGIGLGQSEHTLDSLSHYGIWAIAIIILGGLLVGIVNSATMTSVRVAHKNSVPFWVPVLLVPASGTVVLGILSLMEHGSGILTALTYHQFGVAFLAGVANLIAFAALVKGLGTTSLSYMNLLNASQVAMGALAGIFWFMEPSNGFITAGIVLTIVAILTAK